MSYPGLLEGLKKAEEVDVLVVGGPDVVLTLAETAALTWTREDNGLAVTALAPCLPAFAGARA